MRHRRNYNRFKKGFIIKDAKIVKNLPGLSKFNSNHICFFLTNSGLNILDYFAPSIYQSGITFGRARWHFSSRSPSIMISETNFVDIILTGSKRTHKLLNTITGSLWEFSVTFLYSSLKYLVWFWTSLRLIAFCNSTNLEYENGNQTLKVSLWLKSILLSFLGVVLYIWFKIFFKITRSGLQYLHLATI